jgi:hypothetical protein
MLGDRRRRYRIVPAPHLLTKKKCCTAYLTKLQESKHLGRTPNS